MKHEDARSNEDYRVVALQYRSRVMELEDELVQMRAALAELVDRERIAVTELAEFKKANEGRHDIETKAHEAYLRGRLVGIYGAVGCFLSREILVESR